MSKSADVKPLGQARINSRARVLRVRFGFAMRTRDAITACWLIWLCSVAVPTRGHEGHHSLPTQGVKVNYFTGCVTLSRAARELVDVETVVVDQRNLSENLTANSSLVSPWTKYAVVTSRMAGRVVALFVRPGDRVEAGQVLAELDSLELQSLRWEYEQAQNDIELARRILSGLEPAAKSGAVAGQRLLEAELAYKQKVNIQRVLESKIAALDLGVERLDASGELPPFRLTVRSPIRGVVVHSELVVGKLVDPSEHLMDVIDTSQVWAKIGILERDLHRVSIGQAVRLSIPAFPDARYETRIDKLGTMLDPRTHQYSVWAEFHNSQRLPTLLPGMQCQARITWDGHQPVLTVPRNAIQSDGAKRYVFVEEAATRNESEYRKVAVSLGRQSGPETEIVTERILPGDRVVTRGGHQLSSLFVLGVLRINPESARHMGLRVEPTVQRVVEQVLSLDGVAEIPTDRRANASSQLGGKLTSIHVDRGQVVKAGDLLLKLSSFELRDVQLELLKAHLDSAMWREILARREAAGEAVPRRTLIETAGEIRSSETDLAFLRQKLIKLGMTHQHIEQVLTRGQVIDVLPVHAPIDGTVVDFHRVLGQVVRPDEPLVEIHDPSKLWVQAFVGQRDMRHVRVGQLARVRWVAFPDVVSEGTVARIGPVVGMDSRTQVAWIELSKPISVPLMHNMAARIAVSVDHPPPTLAIPNGAIVRDGLLNFVFVQRNDGSFERRSVELGRQDDRFTEIVSGISSGESLATSGVGEIQTAYAAVR